MKTIVTIGIIILNLFALIVTVKMLSGQDNTKKITYTIVGEIVIFIVCIILYAISGIGVFENVHQEAKWYMIFTMLPINLLIMYCPVLSNINRAEKSDESKEKRKNKMLIWFTIIVVFAIVEVIYIKNIQLGISSFAK